MKITVKIMGESSCAKCEKFTPMFLINFMIKENVKTHTSLWIMCQRADNLVATVVNDHNHCHTYISRQRYVTTLLDYKWLAIPSRMVSAVRYCQ